MRGWGLFPTKEPEGFSVMYTNRSGGEKKPNIFSVFKLFGDFPGEVVPTKVTIGCSLLINRLLQIQLPGIYKSITQYTAFTQNEAKSTPTSQKAAAELVGTVNASWPPEDHHPSTRGEIPHLRVNKQHCQSASWKS